MLGFLTEAEAIGSVKLQGVQLRPEQEAKLVENVKRAIAYTSSITGRKTVVPELRPIPSELIGNRETLLRNEPTFREHLIGMSEDFSIAQIEIAKLHAFQPNLNLEYVQKLVGDAPEVDDIAGLLRFCLPLREEARKFPVIGTFNANSNTFTLTSENLDLRIVGQVQGEDAQTGRRFFGFAYGGGLHQISVVKYKDLYMIKNGYHRAYALLEKGHKFMPCLIVKTDNYQATGASGPGFLSFELMLSDRSPIIADFQSAAAVIYPRTLFRVIISIHGEVQVVGV